MTGSWNSRIFTPQWIGNGRLTNSQTIQIEVPVDEPRAPRRLLFDDVVLEVQSSRITLKVLRAEDALLTRIQAIAVRLLTDLPHTPISGVGMNFSFVEPEPTPLLTTTFSLADTGFLADKEWAVETTDIRRELHKGNSILNLVLALGSEGGVRFDLNYHASPPSTAAALTHVQADILARKNESFELIQATYYPGT